jgi:hypothetical protein
MLIVVLLHIPQNAPHLRVLLLILKVFSRQQIFIYLMVISLKQMHNISQMAEKSTMIGIRKKLLLLTLIPINVMMNIKSFILTPIMEKARMIVTTGML